MKKITLGGAIIGLLATPFLVTAAAMDYDTAIRVLLLTLLWAVSLPIAWGGTEIIAGWCNWAAKTPQEQFSRKLVTPAVLAAGPTLILSRHLYTWFPGGIEGLLVAAATVGAIAPFSWPWVKDHVLARAALELGGRMKLVRDRVTGKTRMIPADEQSAEGEDTQMYVGGSATEVPEDLKPSDPTEPKP